MIAKLFGKICFAVLIVINIWAIFVEEFWVENTTYILFFLLAVIMVSHRRKEFSKPMVLFLGFTVLSYLARFFEGEYLTNEISLLLLSVANVILIMEALNHLVIKTGSSLMLLYFFVVVGFNAFLLGYHVMEMNALIDSGIIFSIYLLYYLILLVLGIIAFIYYLNSYSRKSMFFISLTLGIIFADVLRDMGIFYLQDISMGVAESIIRLGTSIFVVQFFITKEKQLRLFNLMP